MANDSLVTVKIYYEDINGDIGLDDQDTNGIFNVYSKYYFNMIVDYYIRKNNQWEKFELSPGDTLNFNQRIPNLTPTGKNKSIKGTISFPFLASPYPGEKPDTIKLDIFIYDRALNKSNIISPEILLDF